MRKHIQTRLPPTRAPLHKHTSVPRLMKRVNIELDKSFQYKQMPSSVLAEIPCRSLCSPKHKCGPAQTNALSVSVRRLETSNLRRGASGHGKKTITHTQDPLLDRFRGSSTDDSNQASVETKEAYQGRPTTSRCLGCPCSTFFRRCAEACHPATVPRSLRPEKEQKSSEKKH